MPNWLLKFGSYDLPGVESWGETSGSRVEEVTIPLRHGAAPVSNIMLEPRIVAITGRVVRDTKELAELELAKLQTALNSGEQLLCKYSGRGLYAVKRSFDSDPVRGSAGCCFDYSVTFFCANPFYYNLNSTMKNFALTGTSGETIRINYVGSAPTPFILSLTPSGGSFSTVTFTQGSGKYIAFTGTVSASNILLVNTDTAAVTNAGINAISGFSGDFFELQSGVNILTITGTGYAGALAITYFDRWY